MSQDKPTSEMRPVTSHVGIYPAPAQSMGAGGSDIPEPLHGVSAQPDLTSQLTMTDLHNIQHLLPILILNNPQVGLKPVSSPPHPQIVGQTTAIAGGLQVSFNQLTSPTPYGNQMAGGSYRIYRNLSANAFSGAQLIRTIPHDNSVTQKTVTVQDLLGSNKTAAYFCTAVDATGLESTQPGVFQSASVSSANFNPNIASPTPTTASPSISSTSYLTVPEMTVTIITKGNPVLMIFNTDINIPTVVGSIEFAFFRDGSKVSQDFAKTYYTGNGSVGPVDGFCFSFLDTPAAGSHTFDVRALIVANGCTLAGTRRAFQVVELG